MSRYGAAFPVSVEDGLVCLHLDRAESLHPAEVVHAIHGHISPRPLAACLTKTCPRLGRGRRPWYNASEVPIKWRSVAPSRRSGTGWESLFVGVGHAHPARRPARP